MKNYSNTEQTCGIGKATIAEIPQVEGGISKVEAKKRVYAKYMQKPSRSEKSALAVACFFVCTPAMSNLWFAIAGAPMLALSGYAQRFLSNENV